MFSQKCVKYEHIYLTRLMKLPKDLLQFPILFSFQVQFSQLQRNKGKLCISKALI